MKKFLILSIILHALFFMDLKSKKKETKEEPIQIEVVNTPPQNKKKESGNDIVEKGIGEKAKSGYWGIGIYTDDIKYVTGEVYIVITRIVPGYSADRAGLQIGDTIFLLDGNPMEAADAIVGNGPATLELTVLRRTVNGNKTFVIKLEREFIATR